MHKILTYNAISPTGLERLPRDSYEVASEIQYPDAILLRSYDLHKTPIAETMKAVGRAGAGVNNIPVAEYSQRGIPVFNAPGANANAVKELVIAGMLLASRNICQSWVYTRQLTGDDSSLHSAVEKGKKQFAGFELAGKTLGIIGLGAIGIRVANAAHALDMQVIGYDPCLSVDNAWQLSSDVAQASSVDDLMSHCDFLTVHVPVNEHTKGMIHADRIRLLKKNAVILNFARDGIVDNQAICDALDANELHAYVCDFPNQLVKDHPKVIALPHLGASTAEAEDNCAVMVVDQIKDYLENGNILNSVNFPETVMPRNGKVRLTVAHDNIPTMVSQILGCLAEAKLNILDMLNKSRDNIAYTMIDIDSHEIPANIIDHIKAIQGVSTARVI